MQGLTVIFYKACIYCCNQGKIEEKIPRKKEKEKNLDYQGILVKLHLVLHKYPMMFNSILNKLKPLKVYEKRQYSC